MISTVFNNTIGSPYDFAITRLTPQEEETILSGLFEQLLIFDKITISTNRVSFPLIFLLDKLGINKVEELIERGYIQFLIWTPVLVTGIGNRNEDGTNNESAMYGQPPLAAGSLSDEDFDPENNIEKALNLFGFHRDRKRIFKRKASKNFIIPNGIEFSSESANFVINAYKQNNLAELGLPYLVEPEQLNLQQRSLLLKLGSKLLETAVLSKYNFKSYENYEHYKICEHNLKNIGDALKVSTNTSQILTIENIPNLKSLYLNEKLDFDKVIKIRHLSTAKYFRKWINQVSENHNAQEISREYINEIKGNSKFFESNGGKFIRNISLFGVNSALGAAIAGPIGIAAGFGLGMLETYWLDGILKGKNPSMFIDKIREEVENMED